MALDLDSVRENARASTTQDLLDRVTVYREGMEPEAVQVIEEELRTRGIGPTEIRAHEDEYGSAVLRDENGVAYTCSYCDRPAVAQEKDLLFRMGGIFAGVPLDRVYRRYCTEHRPASSSGEE